MTLSTSDKVRLLRDVVRGPDDVFAVRTNKESGWSWRPVYAPLTDEFLILHLRGLAEIGTYALVPHGNGLLPNVRWAAADFDGKKCRLCGSDNAPGPRFCGVCHAALPDWETDVQRAVEFLIESEAPLLVNLSRSAQGAHVRVLFREPVPAWMARRWLNAWLDEAGVMLDHDDIRSSGKVPSFDRVFPPQDYLSGLLTDDGYRKPGNLVGAPMNGARARERGGTLPLDPFKVVKGDFSPDGKHWEHLVTALDARSWGVAELEAALKEAPGSPISTPPDRSAARYHGGVKLPVVHGNDSQLDYMLKFCEFMRHMRDPRNQSYQLWIAMASELHRFGEAGRVAFHELSASHPQYNYKDAELRWRKTAEMSPVRCDTLVSWGYSCPHLTTRRCGGAKVPTYFAEHTFSEIL